MKKLRIKYVTAYVETNIGTFHSKRIQSLNSLKLSSVLRRKNPYLFKAKNVLTSEQIVRGFVDAQISSSEETMFGDWLEGLAIFINERVYQGWKSGIEGIDFEFNKKHIRYIVTIKSGPNWGNSTQVRKLSEDFKKAKRILRTSNSQLTVEAINGCCYGRDNAPDKGDYQKLCGQRFWEFISDSELLYKDIIEPLGHKAKERNAEFFESYAQDINKFTLEFANVFCDSRGKINWRKIVEFNSSK